jgi:glutathione S-transferase
LEEVGVEYEIVNVDFDTGEHKSPEHLQRNVLFLLFLDSLFSLLG